VFSSYQNYYALQTTVQPARIPWNEAIYRRYVRVGNNWESVRMPQNSQALLHVVGIVGSDHAAFVGNLKKKKQLWIAENRWSSAWEMGVQQTLLCCENF